MNAVRSSLTGVSGLSKEKKASSAEFKRIDTNKNNLACREEIAKYVESNAMLWAMLSVNLNISEEHCREVATTVIMELATGRTGRDAEQAEISEKQFHKFRKRYIVDPKGQQEFFHRTVFAAFDDDGNSLLDRNEMDRFLDIFYEAGSIFQGDSRLPESKENLKRICLEKLDANGDGLFSFKEVRSLISGTGGGAN